MSDPVRRAVLIPTDPGGRMIFRANRIEEARQAHDLLMALDGVEDGHAELLRALHDDYRRKAGNYP